MSHQVLARKWRPSCFREMVGQEHVLKALINALDRDRLHHAYLFTGTRGVGKTTIGRIFAKCLNCEQGVGSEPCGQCSACLEIDQGRFIDLIEVDAASRTKVEDTRELMENVQYAPSRGRYKVYLIDEVHMLSNHSFNALLKTLEEPPPHVKFLLATTDPQKLPATILSRCLQFNLKNMPAEQIVSHLQHVLEEESVGFDQAALWLLAEAARGSMRDALSLTDQAIGFGAGNLTEQDVGSMLGTIDRQAVARILQSVVAGDGPALFAEIEHLASLGTDFQALLDDLLGLLHGIAVAQAVPGTVPAARADAGQLDEFARSFSAEDLQIFYQIALNGRRDFPYVPDPKRGFEMVVLRLLTFRPLDAAQLEPVPSEAAPQASPVIGGPPEVKKSEPVCAGQLEVRSKPDAEPAPVEEPTPEVEAEVPLAAAGRPESTVQPAMSPEVPEEPEPLTLETLKPEHWNRLFPELELSGVTRNLAANAALCEAEGEHLRFVLDEEQALVYNEEHRQRWRLALADFFGVGVELEVSTGEPQAETPARYRQRQRAERLQQAVRELEQDENVRLLQERFGARLERDTVEPLG